MGYQKWSAGRLLMLARHAPRGAIGVACLSTAAAMQRALIKIPRSKPKLKDIVLAGMAKSTSLTRLTPSAHMHSFSNAHFINSPHRSVCVTARASHTVRDYCHIKIRISLCSCDHERPSVVTCRHVSRALDAPDPEASVSPEAPAPPLFISLC